MYHLCTAPRPGKLRRGFVLECVTIKCASGQEIATCAPPVRISNDPYIPGRRCEILADPFVCWRIELFVSGGPF
jgi:hypothetical protein